MKKDRRDLHLAATQRLSDSATAKAHHLAASGLIEEVVQQPAGIRILAQELKELLLSRALQALTRLLP